MNREEGVALNRYDAGSFARGRPFWVEAVWWLVQAVLVRSWLPGTAHRRFLLRLFGARIGDGVIIKPGVRVKFPWRLQVGDHTWIGEDVWIDNLARVSIGSHCCVSQGAYLCTGSHDWASRNFDLVVRSIDIGDQAWICAKAIVAPGVTVKEGAVLSMGSAATGDLDAWGLYCGLPAKWIKPRRISKDKPDPCVAPIKTRNGDGHDLGKL